MSDQQDIEYYKGKLQQKNAQFQSYKQECKQIEQMLQEQNQKKQSQIKQLKQQAIKRQKGQKMMKAQVSQLEAELQNLKGQLSEVNKNQANSNNSQQQITKYTTQNSFLKEKISQLQTLNQQLINSKAQTSNQLGEAKNKIQELGKSLIDAQNKLKTAQTTTSTVIIPPPPSQNNSKSVSIDNSKFQEQIKKLKQKITILQKQKSKIEKNSKQEIDKLKHQYQQKLKKASQSIRTSLANKQQKPQKKRQQSIQTSKQIKQAIPLSQHRSQISKLKQTIRSLEQYIQKLQHSNQQNKQKLQVLSNQKSSLLQKVKNLTKQVQKQKDRSNKVNLEAKNQNNEKYQSPNKRESQQIMVMDQHQHQNYNHGEQLSPLIFDCLLLTKRHYISPFIQIKDNKMIKFFKSTKNGFQKSLGATKHKFSAIGYDNQVLVNKTVNDIKLGVQQHMNYHAVVIYGAKSTNKSLLMSSIIQQLKQWLIQKIQQVSNNEQNSVKCVYIKKSQQQQQNYSKEGFSKEQIIQILEQIINMGQNNSSPSKSQVKVPKKNQKAAKIRYFSLSLTQQLNIQVITSSYLNPFLKNNETFMDYINTVVYSKLPNILQSSLTNYHIITTLNPIVNLYEDCKNTLSITLVPLSQNNNQSIQGSPMGGSSIHYNNSPKTINLQDLNDLTKKKLQSFQKQTQQAGMRVRRYQDECMYYKTRFEQLEVRLKNLINTHQQQNTYLKKSPVTLSYEKLLKFVNTVLSRNINLGSNSGIRGNVSVNFGGHTTSAQQYQNQVNIYIEEDAKSLDGY